MSTETPLTKAYNAAMRRGLDEAATALVNSFGSRNSSVDDVPAARHAALTMALEKMMANSTPKTVALMQAAFSGQPPTTVPQTMDDVRRDAFAKRGGRPEPEPAQPPKQIDEKAVAEIYHRWNATPTRE